MKVICFHNPEEENGYLSNWYLSDFTIDNIRFTSMEQFMMYEKACCFNDEKIAKQILATNDVAKIKALGRAVKEYNDSYWNGVRQIIVYKEKILLIPETLLLLNVQSKIKSGELDFL